MAPFALGGALIDQARQPAWARAGLAVTVAWSSNTVIKHIVRRARPNLPDCPLTRPHPDAHSFPSSHATTSFAAAVAFGRLAFAPPLAAIAVTQSLARLALGAHYPSDLIAGAGLGMVIGALVGPRPS